MIIAFANKRLEVSQEEKNYLVELKKTFGDEVFIGLFTSDNEGLITSITPPTSKPIQMIILFFFLNLMLNQRLRKIDSSKLELLEQKIKRIEDKLGIKDE